MARAGLGTDGLNIWNPNPSEWTQSDSFFPIFAPDNRFNPPERPTVCSDFTGYGRINTFWSPLTITTWNIWKLRNNVIFNGTLPVVLSIVDDIKVSSWIWFSNRFGRKSCILFSSWCIDPLACFQITWTFVLYYKGLSTPLYSLIIISFAYIKK
jgi:hypothetical protein